MAAMSVGDGGYDCIIVGGGPAGSTAATVLADYGHRVLVLEKGRFPRHHIGESLMPQTYWVFERIGMLEKLKASDFPRKESVQFVSASGKESQPFYFADRFQHECSTTWQVSRDRFDRMMLDNAREHGAEVREGVLVREVLFEGDRAVGVRAVIDDQPVDLTAQVVVDATGISAVLSRQLGTRVGDPGLKNGAIYAYFQGALRDEGRNAGATIVINTPRRNGWFWYIPLPEDITSVGVVGPPGYLFTGRGDDPMATLQEEIRITPGVSRRVASATCVSQAYVTSDFSYRSRRTAGDGWVMIGDAFGFLDPIYSSGVMLALKSGELAGDAIHEALAAGDVSAERLGTWTEAHASGMQLVRQLVYAFYHRDFSFAGFLKAYPHHHDAVVRVLIGDVYNEELHGMFADLARMIELPSPMALEKAGAPRQAGARA